ncbi:MAG: Mur ligase family protein, partial [Bryobacteraceae bacterium]
MELRRVLEAVPILADVPAALLQSDVRGLAYDSRKVQEGYLFFAFAGAKTDGAQFANAAGEKGALAVVSERPKPGGFRGVWLQAAHGRQALASASRNFYEKPDERVALTAVTGTNGKTTSTLLIDAMLRAAGKITALVGTIEYHLAGRVLPAVNTTPESLDLFRMFHELQQMGGTHATMEASSHALDLGRIYAMNFHTAAFTNFTRDHLDYHQTMEAYFAAKQLLFTPESGAPPRFAVLNADDESARRLNLSSETRVYWYGVREEAAPRNGAWVGAADIQSSFDGLRFSVVAGGKRFPVESPLVGHINVY